MVMEQQDVEKMVRDLSEAIKQGNIENAKDIAGKLADKNAVIDMMYEPPDKSRDKIISIKIHIENKEQSSRRPLEWNVKVSTKIAQLKRLLHQEKGVPESYQRWIVNKRIADDTASLSSCGVTEDGYTVFVYIMSHKPRTVHPGLEGEHTFDISGMGDGGSGPATLPAQPTVRPGSEATTTPRRELPYATMPPMGVTEGGAGSMDPGVSSMDTATGVEEHQIQIGWNCPSCTYLNQPQDRGCHICSSPRPSDYEVPPEYRSVPESPRRSRSRSPSPHDTYQAQRPSHHPQRPHESHPPQRPYDHHPSQRPHESHPPQRPYDHHPSQRPHESHLPQRPQRDTHLPQRPTENSTTATLASANHRKMVYNYETMTYEYQDQAPDHS